MQVVGYKVGILVYGDIYSQNEHFDYGYPNFNAQATLFLQNEL